MSENLEFPPGTIVWRDLTVEDADSLSRFYESVVGWERSVHEGQEDFNMTPPGATEPIAGVCYRVGPNADLPQKWIIYVAVDDVRHSMQQVESGGGRIIDGPRYVGSYLFCVIEDPAGAVLGLISSRPVPRTDEGDGKG